MKGRRKLNLNKNFFSGVQNTARTDSRNRKLAARYFYYARLHRMAYEHIVNDVLPDEFDLSPATIVDVLTNSTQLIHHFRESAIPDLRKEYPYWVWKEPAQLSLF